MASKEELFAEISSTRINRRKYSYELYARNINGKKLPLVLILHGFSDSPSSHTKFAKELARRGCIVLVPKMLLAALFPAHRRRIRQENINGIVSMVEWILNRNEEFMNKIKGEIDSDSIVLVGHSAGGAVAFEAACVMQKHSKFYPKALLLMDAVPWLSTIKRAQSGELKYTTNEISAEKSICTVCSIRAKRAAANANGLIYELIGMTSDSFVDIEFPQAKHLDFVDDSWKKIFYRITGVVSNETQNAEIKRLCFIFLRSILMLSLDESKDGDSDMDYLHIVKSSIGSDLFVVKTIQKHEVSPIDETKLPFYLK